MRELKAFVSFKETNSYLLDVFHLLHFKGSALDIETDSANLLTWFTCACMLIHAKAYVYYIVDIKNHEKSTEIIGKFFLGVTLTTLSGPLTADAFAGPQTSC